MVGIHSTLEYLEDQDIVKKSWHLKKNQKEYLEIKNYNYKDENLVHILKSRLDIVEEILN